MNILTCNNASFGYENKTVICNVSFSIQEGDFLSVLGENGAGKSTLIKGLLGLLEPTKGSIEYNISRRMIGYLPQQVQVAKNFPATVLEVIASGHATGARALFGLGAVQKEQCLKSARMCGVDKLLKEPFCALSAGQQQRVLMARAISAKRRLLILDEPMASVDAGSSEELYKILLDMQKSGVAIIMITHDIPAAIRCSNRILHIDHTDLFFGSVEDYIKSEVFSVWGSASCN